MVTEPFAFIIHPIDPKGDVARKYPLLGKYLPEPMIHFLCTFWPPVFISQIEGVRSISSGAVAPGYFVAAPYTPRRMLEIPEKEVYRKIIQTGKYAEKLGAKILGLGAFTSVVGDAGITIAEHLDIAVTTGDAYTVAIAAEALLEAGRLMDIQPEQTTAAVVGATGAIGSACAALLSEHVGRLILIGRREEALAATCERCEGAAEISLSTDLNAMHDAELIMTVTSSIGAIIEPRHLKPGAVVLDVARPRDVSKTVARERKDVLVIEGGMVEVPGPVNFNFNFGFPPGKAYACMAETMALALEGKTDTDYTLGRNIELARIREIGEMASRHGFRLSGLRSFEREVTAEHIEQVRERAHHALRQRPALGSV